MSDRCDHIRDEIRNLEQLIDALQAELQTAAGALKLALIVQIKQAQAELAGKAEDLKACEAAEDPPLTDPRVFGSEITQGLVEYELVAGKL